MLKAFFSSQTLFEKMSLSVHSSFDNFLLLNYLEYYNFCKLISLQYLVYNLHIKFLKVIRYCLLGMLEI